MGPQYTSDKVGERVNSNFLQGTTGGNAGPIPGSVHAYRGISPGTAAIESKIAVPTEEEESRIYDIKYYSRDTRRSKEHSQIKVITHPSIMITDGDAAPLAIGSPGTFANAAVATYDETGLRSAMSATHEQMNASIAKYLPTHLPEPEWAADAEKIIADYQSKGLAPVPGKSTGWKHEKSGDAARQHLW